MTQGSKLIFSAENNHRASEHRENSGSKNLLGPILTLFRDVTGIVAKLLIVLHASGRVFDWLRIFFVVVVALVAALTLVSSFSITIHQSEEQT